MEARDRAAAERDAYPRDHRDWRLPDGRPPYADDDVVAAADKTESRRWRRLLDRLADD